MSLDLSRLENVRERGRKIIARCPACAEHDHDEKGEHLVIMPDGKFGCVVYPGAAGKAHRQRVFALAGDASSRRRGSCAIRVARPDHERLPEPAGTEVALTQLGTAGTGCSDLRVMREAGEPVQDTYGNRGRKKASQPSQTAPDDQDDEPCRLADVIDPDAAVAFMRLLVGDKLPTLSKRFGTVQAALDAMSLGWSPEDSGLALRLQNMHQDTAALAALHAGMVLVGALQAGQDPREAGETATDAFCEILCITPRDTPASDIDPETGHPIIDGAICPF